MRTQQLYGLDATSNPRNVRPINTPDERNGILFPRGSRRTTRPGMQKQNAVANDSPVMFMAELHSDDCNTDTGLAIAGGELQTLPFPTNFVSDSADGYIFGVNTSYATARSTSSSFATSANSIIIGQTFDTLNYTVLRGFLLFDTSSIPDTALITDVKLKMVFAGSGPTPDFDIRIHKFNWDSPITGVNREANYDGALASDFDQVWQNTAGIAFNEVRTSPALDTSHVNKTGFTKYALISSLDLSSNAPADFSELAAVWAQETSGKEPILIVQFTV